MKKPEDDEGYVTLVNAKKDADGNITECKERTGMWAWKHPHSADGNCYLTQNSKGDVRFDDVTFGYTQDKTSPPRHDACMQNRVRNLHL